MKKQEIALKLYQDLFCFVFNCKPTWVAFPEESITKNYKHLYYLPALGRLWQHHHLAQVSPGTHAVKVHTKRLLNRYLILPDSSSDTTWICLKIQISNSILSPYGCNMDTSMWPFWIEIHRNLWPLCHSPTQNQKSIPKSFQHVLSILTRRKKGSLLGLSHLNSSSSLLPFLPSYIYL